MYGRVQFGLIFLILLLLALWMFLKWSPLPQPAASDPRKVQVSEALNKMKRLWTERSYLTRMANVESINDYNGASLTNERLVANGNQLARNLTNLYNQEAGDALSQALMNYNQDMYQLMVKARQHKDINFDVDQLREKGYELADLFHSLCPCLDVEKLRALLDANTNNFVQTTLATIREKGVEGMAFFDAYLKTSQDLSNYLEENIWCHLMGTAPRHA